MHVNVGNRAPAMWQAWWLHCLTLWGTVLETNCMFCQILRHGEKNPEEKLVSKGDQLHRR